MARQTGKILFLGTRLGCTGYILDGKAYIRRRSSLDGKRCKRDAAFARSRAAAAVFGGAARFTARLWRGIPAEMKRLMDGGAYNRLVNAVREAHVLSASEVVWRAGAGGRPSYPELVVPTFSLGALGGLLNGLDLSAGQILADGVELVARDRRGGFYCGVGHLMHVNGVTRVGFLSEEGIVKSEKLWGEGDAVRVRILSSSLSTSFQYNRGQLGAVACNSVGEWVVVEDGMGSVMVDLPAVEGDCLRFVGLEVAVKRKGRWKRLVSACKVFVLENCTRIRNEELGIRNEIVGSVVGVRGPLTLLGGSGRASFNAYAECIVQLVMAGGP